MILPKTVDDMDVIADVCIHRPVMKLPFDPNAEPSRNDYEGEENPDPRTSCPYYGNHWSAHYWA